MKTSAAGRALIAQREGRRLAAYRDVRGILTIGIGHTGRMSPPPVTAGMTITDAQCDAMLADDLGPVEAAIRDAVKVPVSQNEFDALASLGFNIGGSALRRSTVVKRLNGGDIPGAAQAFLSWSKPAVLVGRRKAEMAQFLARAPPETHEVSAGHALAAARAATLATLAATTKAKARTAQSGAAALVAGGGTTALAAHAHHLPPMLVGGALLAAAGICMALVAICRHRAAASLVANAGQQGVIAPGGMAAPPLSSSSLQPSDRTQS